jgi:uncharacterized protein YjbI with pentapeptide repeats
LCVFRNCSFIDINLRGQNLANFTFENCLFRNVNMSGCDLINTSFINCRLVSVGLTGAKFKPERTYAPPLFIKDINTSKTIT